MSVNSCLNVRSEIVVWNRRIAEILFVRLRNGDALAKPAAWAVRSPNHRDGPGVPLDDYLQALIADSGQDGMNVGGEFGFCEA